MLASKFGATPMKAAETQQLVFRIIIAFVFLGILLYASIVFSGERVVTLPDGESTWKMTIQPKVRSSQNAISTPQPSDKLNVIPVQFTKSVDQPHALVPPPPATPQPKASDVPEPVAPEEIPPASEVPCTNCTASSGLSYAEIYRSIPFSRAEYLANPSYRHEATMEIMMGQLRPTVTHKTYRAKVQGSFPARLPYRTHYQIAPLDPYRSGFYPRYYRPNLYW